MWRIFIQDIENSFLQRLWTLLCRSFEFEMSCMSDTGSFALPFHTPTFFTNMRISWNSWPWFSRWLQIVRRLSSSWVSCVPQCVFVLFRCVVWFVVGWQQHCRSIIIDAMFDLKSWKSEDKSGTGKTLKSMDWVWILTSGYEDFYLQHCISWRLSWLELREFYFRLWTGESIWVWSLRHWVRVRHRSFGMMSHHLSFVLEERRIILWLFLDSWCDLEPWILFVISDMDVLVHAELNIRTM